jgi:hypothetical protein
MTRKIRIEKDLSTIQNFVKELSLIKEEGYIKSHRKGPTGIGKTLEDKLGITENCISSPDLGTVELKAARYNSNSMLTLTTKSPDLRGANTYLRDNYGYKTQDSIALNPNLNILHSTVNGMGFNTLNGEPYLKLTFKDNRMYLEHAKDGILENVYWGEESLTTAFRNKYPFEKLYYVKANCNVTDGSEYFHYVDAYYLDTFSAEKMLENIKSGIIDIDIRIGIYTNGKYKGKSHDHGTGIRIRPDRLELCFENSKKLI